MTKLLVAIMSLLAVTGCSSSKLQPDTSPSAIESGDPTALIEGCGNQVVAGYTYCRMKEGDVPASSLFLIVPPAKCAGDGPCVFYKFYQPDGSASVGGSVPRQITRVEIKWRDLIKKDKFETGDRGFWPFTYEIHWTDKDGKEQKTVAEGEIRLRVIHSSYISLFESTDDPNFVWVWSDKNRTIKMTTGARVYVGR